MNNRVTHKEVPGQENITLSKEGENPLAIDNGKKSYINQDLHPKGHWRNH